MSSEHKDLGEPVGTTAAHGRTWPMYERSAFQVEVEGQIAGLGRVHAERLLADLQQMLNPYGVTVKLTDVTVVFMSPEDQAEKDELDEKAIESIAA